MTPDSPLLVTGGYGRLGTALGRRLDADGRPWARLEGVDLANAGAIEASVRAAAPTAIIHLAAINGAACDIDLARTEAINVTATRVIGRAAADAGARRIVFTSSAAVYGDERDTALRETDEVRPLSSYGESKVRAEDALREVSGRALQSVALRIFNLYGPGFDHSLVSGLQTATPPQPAVLRGLDTFVRDYVHVDDVVEAILAALAVTLTPETVHARINVASGERLTNGELVARLEERPGAAEPLSYRVGVPQRSYSYANIDLARELLGYVPRRFVGDGRETA